MDLHFEASQEHQLLAIQAVVNLFQGQSRKPAHLNFELGAGAATIPNVLDLDAEALLTNLQAVQEAGRIRPDPALALMQVDGTVTSTCPNFSVEMETGTGKTYVYLRTALELAARYGLRKYIVVVPSVAIREGVLATLRSTQRHFADLFDRLPYQFYRYDSANLNQIAEFALSDSIQLMVMTLDAFNKAENVIRQSRDFLQGEVPLHLVQASRPILILDEPQNMESDQSKRALALLNPLLTLRYSATHRNPYNLLYRLSPYEAYRRSLVKRIEVASIVQDGEVSAFLRLDSTESARGVVKARVAVHVPAAGGAVRERVLTLKPGDDLAAKTGRSDYGGFVVEEIDRLNSLLRFSNGVELAQGVALGPDRVARFKAQIRYTVEEHFRKQERLKPLGIKVLSLFFIDRVDNYAAENGIIRQLFDDALKDIGQRYPAWQGVDPARVQAGYFAQKRTRGGRTEVVDSSGDNKQDEAAFSLIMREKERLLSLDEPVAFIFSHSALREGWDNPNVFQVCTLNQAVSETRRRQEVGRGVRLAVDQQGLRVQESRVNVLTVVASEGYDRYVAGLQSEVASEYQAEIEARYGKSMASLTEEERAKVAEEYGADILPPKPENARLRSAAVLRKAHLLSPEFAEMWERIRHRTRYSVSVNTRVLLESAVPDIDELEIRAPRITATKAAVVTVGETFQAEQMTQTLTVATLEQNTQLPNVVELMEEALAQGTPPLRLTRQTLYEVYCRTTNQAAARLHPQAFAAQAARVLRRRLIEQLVAGIKYHKDGTWYEMRQFQEQMPSWFEHLVPASRALYDQVIVDSLVERQFVLDLEARDDVKVYVKLPAWFKVSTPLGSYNPDWAIVMEPRDAFGTKTGEELLYLVRETKGTTVLDELREKEQQKVRCGERHFRTALNVDYRVVVTAGELP